MGRGVPKKFDEFVVGEHVVERGFVCGELVSKAHHPTRGGRGYLFIRNGKGEYTIYSCMSDARCSLSTCRHVPAGVMRKFAEVVMDFDGDAEVPSERPTVAYEKPSVSSPAPASPSPSAARPTAVLPEFDFIF